MNYIDQCKKCGGSGQQINYRAGHNVESRCASCAGHGFRAVSKRPKGRDSFINVRFVNDDQAGNAQFFISDGFDFEAVIDRFNHRVPNQKIRVLM